MKIRDAYARLRVPLIATVGCAVVALVTLRGLVSDKDQAQYVAFEREIEGALNSRRQFAVGAVLTVFVAGGYFLI